MKATAICDGRGNAGTGARACVMLCECEIGTIRRQRAERIKPTTNIVAEHLAIQLAMELAEELGVTDLLILNDSQTPVNQVNGIYKVKEVHLKPIVEKTWEMGQKFDTVAIKWVPREQTKAADTLCRQVDRPSARRSRPGGELQAPPERKNPFARS
jgi:ribonuclease HI